jgi:hypothetical protein
MAEGTLPPTDTPLDAHLAQALSHGMKSRGVTTDIYRRLGSTPPSGSNGAYRRRGLQSRAVPRQTFR